MSDELKPRRRGRPSRLRYSHDPFDRLTHYLFRYPAKFHPPVARALIEQYSDPGELILDPFCGSGTLLVEAMTLGRNAVGSDIDPIAVFVSRGKTRRISIPALRASATSLLRQVDRLCRSDADYIKMQFVDITNREYENSIESNGIEIPQIPNIFHWFRRYVLIDLAHLRQTIQSLDAPQIHREFFLLCFAAIIRNASNADPVPVSGLEVTSHMKKLDASGRVINPFALFERILTRSLRDIEQFSKHAISKSNSVRVVQADATQLGRHVRTAVDAVITSPPYHNAVDYYRRHNLEMYWLNLVADYSDRLNLLPKYIGRSHVPQNHPFVHDHILTTKVAKRWESTLRQTSTTRADAFKHYMVAMKMSLDSIGKMLPRGKPAVFVLGKNTWNSQKIPTVDLFKELAADHYELVERFW